MEYGRRLAGAINHASADAAATASVSQYFPVVIITLRIYFNVRFIFSDLLLNINGRPYYRLENGIYADYLHIIYCFVAVGSILIRFYFFAAAIYLFRY
ncbi:hypothetical protein [Serratia rubidaea]|uniref:hypothetical protein n=1 Tax=Serratia rubidaea TaxID=61652 RepID=UPI00077389AD|nr:hypothetical protein [Serratia rubidaea]